MFILVKYTDKELESLLELIMMCEFDTLQKDYNKYQ